MQKVVSALLSFVLLCSVTASGVKADAVTELMQIPEISSKAAVLMDATIRQILFQKKYVSKNDSCEHHKNCLFESNY